MTLEELKVEAARHGYSLRKNDNREKLLPCICGCNRRETWYGQGDRAYILKCKVCDRESYGKTLKEARSNWNRMIVKGDSDENDR